jgi:hypothetical protein
MWTAITATPERGCEAEEGLEGKLDVLRVECTKCDREGRYHVHYGRERNDDLLAAALAPLAARQPKPVSVAAGCNSLRGGGPPLPVTVAFCILAERHRRKSYQLLDQPPLTDNCRRHPS